MELLIETQKGDFIWFDKTKEGKVSIGMNMKSHTSVDGRWDISLSAEQTNDLIKYIKGIEAVSTQ